MTIAKLTASTAALFLSSTALMAQEAQFQSLQSVFVDVGGTAVLVPADVALEACGFDQASLQSAAESRLRESGADETEFFAQMETAMRMMGQGREGGTGDAAAQDTASVGADDTSGTMGNEGMTTADAGGTTSDAGATGTETSDVQNVDLTAADTSGDAGGMGAPNADPFIALAACQIDQARATELQVDMTQTGTSLGFDAATLGIQSGPTNQ